MWDIIDQPTGMASIGNLHKQLFISHKYPAVTLSYVILYVLTLLTVSIYIDGSQSICELLPLKSFFAV